MILPRSPSSQDRIISSDSKALFSQTKQVSTRRKDSFRSLQRSLVQAMFPVLETDRQPAADSRKVFRRSCLRGRQENVAVFEVGADRWHCLARFSRRGDQLLNAGARASSSRLDPRHGNHLGIRSRTSQMPASIADGSCWPRVPLFFENDLESSAETAGWFTSRSLNLVNSPLELSPRTSSSQLETGYWSTTALISWRQPPARTGIDVQQVAREKPRRLVR